MKEGAMAEPTTEEQRAIDHKFFNVLLRDAAGFTHATETDSPNFEMNRIIRRAAGQTVEEN
jgi:hypothetical protein